jgi:hydrogenase maturation factor HypF (carbamoyltransferase family)
MSKDHFHCAKCGLRFKIIQRLDKSNTPSVDGDVPVCDDCFKEIMDKLEAKQNGN